MGGGNEDSETQAKDTEKNIDNNITPDVSRRESPDNPPETPTFDELNLAFKGNGVNGKPRSNLVSGANPEAIIQSSALEMQTQHGSVSGRVSVQGIKSLGGHFACLCRGFEFYEVKKKICYYFSKRKWKYFYTFYHFYSEKSSKRAK